MLRYRGRYDHFSTVRNSQARIRDRFLTNSRLLTITVNGTDFITLKVKRISTNSGSKWWVLDTILDVLMGEML